MNIPTHPDKASSLEDLQQLAIDAAGNGDWPTAIVLNEKILNANRNDIPTLNRLGKALAAQGQIHEAKEIYEQVLLLEPQNPIALKNLEKIAILTQNNTNKIQTSKLDPNIFLRQNNTKIISLVNIGSHEVCASLACGDSVKIIIRNRTVAVIDEQNRLIGKLPDDIAFKLHQKLKLGSQFSACIKNTSSQKVQIILKESGLNHL